MTQPCKECIGACGWKKDYPGSVYYNPKKIDGFFTHLEWNEIFFDYCLRCGRKAEVVK